MSKDSNDALTTLYRREKDIESAIKNAKADLGRAEEEVATAMEHIEHCKVALNDVQRAISILNRKSVD